MSSNFNFDKFIPTFGSEILDELYKETPIVSTSFEDFLKLPVNEGYKPREESKTEEIKTEKEEIEMSLGFIEKNVDDKIIVDK